MKKMILILFLVTGMVIPVFAAPCSLKVTVKDQNGAGLASAAVQVTQPACITSPNGPDYLGGGALKTDETPSGSYIHTNGAFYVSATTSGPNQYVSQGSGGARLRIWSGANPATVITNKGYYGYFDYNLKGATDNPFDQPGTAVTNLKADAPPAPTIGDPGVSYVETGGNLVGQASIPITADPHYEYASPSSGPFSGSAFELQTRKAGTTAWSASLTSGSPGFSLSNLAMGTTFEAQARCRSWFGISPWSAIKSFKTAGMGVGGGPLIVNFNFQALSGGLGVNTFNFPFTTVSSPTAIATVKDLAMAIVNQDPDPGNQVPVITTIGWWDAVKMQPAGYTVTKSGTDYIFAGTVGLGDAATVNLVKDQSYQVSVTRACTLTMTGTR